MAPKNNPVVNSLTFTGSVAGQAVVQAQGIAGGLTLQLPNIPPIQGQLMTATSILNDTVVLGWSSPTSGGGGTPGGTDGQLQWNNGGAFDGVAGSLIDAFGTVTIAPTAGSGNDALTITGNGNTALTVIGDLGGADIAHIGSIVIDAGNNIHITEQLFDQNGSSGTQGQVLTPFGSPGSPPTGVAWSSNASLREATITQVLTPFTSFSTGTTAQSSYGRITLTAGLTATPNIHLSPPLSTVNSRPAPIVFLQPEDDASELQAYWPVMTSGGSFWDTLVVNAKTAGASNHTFAYQIIFPV